MRYETLAEAYRDLEQATGRLVMIDRIAGLIAQTPAELLPAVALLCQGKIAPDFAGVDIGLAERLAARAVGTAAGVPQEQVLLGARETGDLGLAAERLLTGRGAARTDGLNVVGGVRDAARDRRRGGGRVAGAQAGAVGGAAAARRRRWKRATWCVR